MDFKKMFRLNITALKFKYYVAGEFTERPPFRVFAVLFNSLCFKF